MANTASDSFGARGILTVGDRSYDIFRLDRLDGWQRLPYSLKVLLENLLRCEDGTLVTAEQVRALAAWEPSAEHGALALLERSAVTSALRSLPARQREAVVLRYYADFSEADIAQAMGISRGAVKSHTARALAALKSSLERESS